MTTLTFDHLAVTAPDLDAGTAWVEASLGVELAPGGKHPVMGTHNRLLGLASHEYLEVITVDPEAPAPDRARWFGLDQVRGPPRLTNWVLRCDDIDTALAALPPGAGRVLALQRGDLRWRMAVPDNGLLPFDGLFPALIQWHCPHPAPNLPDSGCHLVELSLAHPRAKELDQLLSPFLDAPRIHFLSKPRAALSAVIDTPTGRKVLRG